MNTEFLLVKICDWISHVPEVISVIGFGHTLYWFKEVYKSDLFNLNIVVLNSSFNITLNKIPLNLENIGKPFEIIGRFLIVPEILWSV